MKTHGLSVYDIVVTNRQRPDLNVVKQWVNKLKNEHDSGGKISSANMRSLISATNGLVRGMENAWDMESDTRPTASYMMEKSLKFSQAINSGFAFGNKHII